MIEPRHKMMINKLYDLVQRGHIEDWAEDFILSLKRRADMGLELSFKQGEKLEALFEAY